MAYRTHGRNSASDPSMATIPAGSAGAMILAPFPENGWVVHVIYHGGKNPAAGGTPTVAASVYDVASNAPDDKVAGTARHTPAALMDYGGAGDVYTRPINWTGGGSGSPLQTALKARSGVRYAVDLNVQGSGELSVGMSTVWSYTLFRDSAVSSTPPAEYDVDQAQYPTGEISVALGYYQNTKPVASYGGPTGLITTGTPVIMGSFSDAEEVYGDRMTLYQVSVRDKLTNVLVWNPDAVTADSSEKADGEFAITYAGDALVAGRTYQAQVRVADEHGTWSNWTAWTDFTYGQAGNTGATAPSGKQNAITGLTFSGVYAHPLLLAADRVRLLIKQNGSTVYESNELVKAIAAPASPQHGVTFSVAQADLAPALTLQWGGAYTSQWKVRDSSGQWSSYGAAVSFTTNARPTIPANFSPLSGTVTTTRPLITFTATDADNPSASLISTLRIKNATGTVLFTRTPTWNASRNRFEYQTTPTDLATFGTYRFDAAVSDGVLSSAYSAEIVIDYVTGPTVSFVRPLDLATVLTTRTRMTWQIDSGDQAQFNLEIRSAPEGSGPEPPGGYDQYIWSTGWVVDSVTRDYQIPDSQELNILDNENWYRAIIHVKNASGIEGTASSTFYVQFPPVRQPEPVSVALVPGRFDSPNFGTQALIQFGQTDYPPSQFEEYRVTKRLASQTPGQARTIFRSSSPVDTRFIDDNVRSGNTEYVYAVTQLVRRDGDLHRSERVEGSVTVSFPYIIINDAVYSADFRVVIRHWTEVGADNEMQGTARTPWGAEKPVVVFGSQNYDLPTIIAQFVDDEHATGLEYHNALNQLRDRQQPVMIRHPRGMFWFASIVSVDWDYSTPGMYIATIEAIQNNYTEGLIL